MKKEPETNAIAHNQYSVWPSPTHYIWGLAAHAGALSRSDIAAHHFSTQEGQ
jgi:hypothetical protein